MKVATEDLIGPLNEIEKKYAPRFLYIEGDRRIAEISPSVSVVGSRHPSEEGLKNAQKIVGYLAKRKVVVVSGLASGIDTMSHRTAIDNGGKTIAVLGTSLDRCYPKENYGLQMEIMRNHLAISQFPPGSAIQPRNFPMRNRTMALISDASIIVEAGDTSGSLHQGWEALRLGRPLMIVDTILDDKKLKWPGEMIKYGAIILSTKRIESLLENLPASGTKADINAAISS